MGTNQAGSENIRKLQKTGQGEGSYMLTLPKEYVRKLGWREKQKVVVTQIGDKLIIEDWKE